MNKDNPIKNLNQLLAIQIRQLQKMILTETRRLAFLNSDKPQRAVALQEECDRVFSGSVGIQKKIDQYLDLVDLKSQPKEKQKHIGKLKAIVRKLAKRNFELNQQSQRVLNGLMSELAVQIDCLKNGKKMVRSYHVSNKVPRSRIISGQL